VPIASISTKTNENKNNVISVVNKVKRRLRREGESNLRGIETRSIGIWSKDDTE